MMRPVIPGKRARLLGVTLIELAVTIALVGIVAALIVNFAMPVRSYIDTSRRAALADAADTALRRIGRDLHLALPNSVRVSSSGGIQYLEFMLVRAGGRYRAEADTAVGANTCGTTAGDVLDIGAADTCFVTLGDVASVGQVAAGTDYLVVYNLPYGTPNADAYEFPGTGGNKSLISGAVNGAGVDRFTFASNTFGYESPGKRFFVIEGPVTFACNPTAGTLTRHKGYAISASPAPPSGGSSALMVGNVKDCSFAYSSAASQGSGLVTLWLELKMLDSRGSEETVSLLHAVHVNNVP